MQGKTLAALVLMLIWADSGSSQAQENTLIFGLKGNVGSLDYIEVYR